ncbi:outer membrane protein assembly factor BamB family protein [Mycobacterium sp. NPDC004974]
MTFPPQGFPPPGSPNPWPNHDPFGPGSSANFPSAGNDPFGPGQPVGWPNQVPLPAATPPGGKNNKTLLILLTVVAVLIVSVGTGAMLWRLNSGENEPAADAAPQTTSPTAATTQPKVTPTTAEAPPGSLRPPRDITLSSLERAPGAPMWTYGAGSPAHHAGGNSNTVVVKSDRGIIALDASTGAPRWPQPFIPPGMKLDDVLVQCVIESAESTVACAIEDFKTQDVGFVLFADLQSGAQKGYLELGTRPRDIQAAGNSFVVATWADDLIGYDADGTVSWRDTGFPAAIYGDQRVIVMSDGRALDANTGRVLARVKTKVPDSIAFAAGFAIRNGRDIEFYDFSGNKTWTMSDSDFKPVKQKTTRVTPNNSTGFYHPIFYNTSKMKAIDGISHEELWTANMGYNPAQVIRGLGSAETCSAFALRKNNIGMSLQRCDTQGDDFIDIQPSLENDDVGPQEDVVGFDGKRVLLHHDETLICVDAANGQELWTVPNVRNAPVWVGKGLYVDGRDGVARLY